MTPAARHQTAIELLDEILGGEAATPALSQWARRSRHAGSSDRAAVRDIVFDCLRRKRSLAHLGGALTGRALVAAYVFGGDASAQAIFSGATYAPEPLTEAEVSRLADPSPAPDPVTYDYPDFLDAELKRSLGDALAPVMEAMRSRAPVDLRVNQGKASVEAAQDALRGEGITTTNIEGLPGGLRITENARRIGASQAYLDGLVELQDASSQQVALFAQAQPGMVVLDYCAGGGGKALALYDAMGGTGQVVAHDSAPARMGDLPARVKRAGAQISVAGAQHKALRGAAFDLVFVDAPCSGTGSWRRTPDAKWRLTEQDLIDVRAVQSEILDTAAGFVRPGGCLIYATCSLLITENDDQVSAFLGRKPEFELEDHTHLSPLTGGDGFFAARMRFRIP